MCSRRQPLISRPVLRSTSSGRPLTRRARARRRSDPEVGRSQVSANRARRSIASGTSRPTSAAHTSTSSGFANGDRVEVRLTLDRYYALVAGTFADAPPGELIIYEDSYGLITLAISNGDAARLTGASPGDELRIAVE